MDATALWFGRTADVFGYTETNVIKLYKPFMSDDAIKAEFAIATIAHGSGLPTPRPIELVVRENRTGIVYEWVAGSSLLKMISDNPLRLKAMAKIMAELHCRINAVPYTDAKNDQKANIEFAIQRAPGVAEEDKTRVVAYLRSLPEGNRLCHGDFHPDNVIMGEKAWIIDWMTGSSGNPLCDIARSKLIIEASEIPGSVPPAMRLLLRIGQRKLAKAYLAEYCRISKAKRDDIDVWVLPLCVARLNEHLSEAESRVIHAKIRKEMRKRKLTGASA